MNLILQQITAFLRAQFNVLSQREDESSFRQKIEEGINFQGFNAWILISAIFIASLGLNVNSTAVIIGAMLISPLMGPIIGIGLALGINDVSLLRKAFRNLLIATIISILTACFYFWITPLDQAQSELLARTSPTLYDVLIAFLGGAAGVVALSNRKGGGNVIPGVAIATALMPPLCTAGYGLATGQWNFFLGAFLLYFINAVFIGLATFLGVRLMRFSPIAEIEQQKAQRQRHYILGFMVLALLPAFYFTYDIVRNSFAEQAMHKFVEQELRQEGTHILSATIHEKAKTIEIIAMGKEISAQQQQQAQKTLIEYALDDYQLRIIQGTLSDSLLAQQQFVAANHTLQSQQKHNEQQQQIRILQQRLTPYVNADQQAKSIAQELRSLFPQVRKIALLPTKEYGTDSLNMRQFMTAIVSLEKQMELTQAERKKLRDWLRTRTQADSLILLQKTLP